jgi:hypothetical protein
LQSETDVNVQTELIRLLAEYRSSEGIPVLADLVRASDADVWKTALDALVTIGGDDSRTQMERARLVASIDRQPWIAEAIDQIRAEGQRPG